MEDTKVNATAVRKDQERFIGSNKNSGGLIFLKNDVRTKRRPDLLWLCVADGSMMVE